RAREAAVGDPADQIAPDRRRAGATYHQQRQPNHEAGLFAQFGRKRLYQHRDDKRHQDADHQYDAAQTAPIYDSSHHSTVTSTLTGAGCSTTICAALAATTVIVCLPGASSSSRLVNGSLPACT